MPELGKYDLTYAKARVVMYGKSISLLDSQYGLTSEDRDIQAKELMKLREKLSRDQEFIAMNS